jgi:hypothetical protein
MAFKINDFHKKIVALVIGGAIFILLGWKLAVDPVTLKLRTSRMSAQTVRQRSELISEIHKLKAALSDQESGLLKERERHLILAEVTKLANTNQVSVESVNPSISSGKDYVLLTLTIKAMGSFKALLDFFLAAEESRNNLTISSVSISSERSYGYDNTGSVTAVRNADIVLETLLKKGA